MKTLPLFILAFGLILSLTSCEQQPKELVVLKEQVSFFSDASDNCKFEAKVIGDTTNCLFIVEANYVFSAGDTVLATVKR